MTTKRGITGVDIGTQIPLLEKKGPHWLLWLQYDMEIKDGVYLRLMGDGQIWKEVISHGKATTKIIKNKS